MLGFVEWLLQIKNIKTKDIDWYSITDLFDEYRKGLKNENEKVKEKRR